MMPPDQDIDISSDGDIDSKTKMELDDDLSDDDEGEERQPSNRKSDTMRRSTHSEIERRRREKMNRHIEEIAQLLPIEAAKKLDKLTVLRVAVDTIKHIRDASSQSSSIGFGKQMFLTDDELLGLILATIDQMKSSFFLTVECRKGRICYASGSVEFALGYKPAELCSHSFFDIVHPDDTHTVRQQLPDETTSSPSVDKEESDDSKSCQLTTMKQNCLDAGSRRSFSCRICPRRKQSANNSSNSTDDYITVDFVGYIKRFSLAADSDRASSETTTSTTTKPKNDRRRSSSTILSPSDVSVAIGTSPVLCLIAMGNVPQRVTVTSQQQAISEINENIPCNNSIDRVFISKLNIDGCFTYLDNLYYSLLGYISQELLDMNLFDYVHDDDRDQLKDVWNRVHQDRRRTTSGIYRFRTKDNLYIDLQTVFEPFVNPWNDEIEIVIAKNAIKTKSMHSTGASSESEDPLTIDAHSPIAINRAELIRQLLPSN